MSGFIAAGLVLILLGYGVMRFSRETEGISGAFLFMLGLAMGLMGLYFVFVERGEGLARFFPFLSR